MLEAGVVHTIFPCLDQLLEWHSGFLSELLSRRKQGLVQGSSTNFTVRRIGDLLLRQVSLMVLRNFIVTSSHEHVSATKLGPRSPCEPE